MLDICPRCATPRVPDGVICASCGLDFRTWTPAWACPRCGTQVAAGMAHCPTCGLDQWADGAAGRAGAGGPPTLVVALGLIGVLTVAVAMVGVLLASQVGRSSVSGAAKQTTAAPTLSLAASASPTSRPSLAPTAEPSPVGEWQTFTAPDGSFSVLMPGNDEPGKFTQSAEISGFTIDLTLYTAMDANGAVYMAGWEVLPEDLLSSVAAVDEDAILDDIASGVTYGSGGTVVDRYETTMASHPAYHVVVENGNSIMEFRFCLVTPRVYVLIASRPEYGGYYPDYFMNSFELH
jgi:hypothetical protein